MTVRRARPDELAWANDVYRRVDFVASDADCVQVVAEDDGRKIGVGRLVPAGDGAYELGGMWVDEDARGRGVAKAIVAALIEAADGAPLWCIPYARVADLYRGRGFFDAVVDDAPVAVREKLAFCRARYPLAVVLLRR